MNYGDRELAKLIVTTVGKWTEVLGKLMNYPL